MKHFLFILLFAMCLPAAAQTPNYDDMTMESDETEATYRAAGKNYVFIKSKRGSSGMTKTSSADSVKTFGIKEIVRKQDDSKRDPGACQTHGRYRTGRMHDAFGTNCRAFQ